MCIWLDSTTYNRIPAFAAHYVGVGGVVINDKDEVLLIQEIKQPEPRLWKFPGGLVDPGETIKDALIREVYEETGVKVLFEGILGLREQLEYRNGAADIYIVCLMKPDASAGDQGVTVNIQDKIEISSA